MKISPARVAAFDVLARIDERSEFSSSLLPQFENRLNEKDRALCHEIVLGVLRRQIYFDRVIDEFGGGKRLDAEVRIACRIGIYQLQFLDRIPEHSIANDSVNLVARARKTSAKGFVNALLRRTGRAIKKFEFADDTERVSVETSHPRWLIERWAEQFGPETAEWIAAANNEQVASAFRFTAATTNETRQALSGQTKSRFVPGCFFAETDLAKLREFAEAGEIYFQDEASQMAGISIKPDGRGRILDVCAAPGGKTAQIAMHNPEVMVIAADRSGKRLSLMKENLLKQGAGDVPLLQLDAKRPLPFAESSFDIVFVDAPCSGTGTIRHNPEIRYFVTAEEIAAKHLKQLGILENASKLVRPGGLLQYSTCSLETEENESTVMAFLGRNGGFSPEVPDGIPGEFITPEGFARTFPNRDRTDGFFIAALRREA